MKKPRKGLVFLLIICGAIFIALGVFSALRKNEFKKNGITTQAEIVRIERQYSAKRDATTVVYVEYTVGDTVYTELLDFYSSTMREGSFVPIVYLPDNPQKITYGKFSPLFQIVFYAAGIILIGFGIWELIRVRTDNAKMNALQTEGRKIIAKITSYTVSRNVKILNKSPAVLLCEGAHGEVYKTKFLVGYDKNYAVGDEIIVYVDVSDSQRYMIET